MQETISRYVSIDKMFRIGLNVPEIIINLPRPKDMLEYQKYHTILEEIYRAIRSTNLSTVYIDNKYEKIKYLKHSELKEILRESEYGKEGVLILKAPRTQELYKGYIIPGPHYFTATFLDSETEVHVPASEPKRFVWGMHRTFTVKYAGVLQQLNDTLTNRRLDLDGSCVEFTYHPAGEGVLTDNLLFWGFKHLKYTGDE